MKIFKQTAILLGFVAMTTLTCTFCTGCTSALLVGAGGVAGYVVHDKVEKGELKIPCFTEREKTKN